MSTQKAKVVSDLEAHVGFWLRYVSNHVSLAFARKVEALGVTVAEWVVLRHLFEVEASAPSRLAERMGMTRGAVSRLGERLLGKGLVKRIESSADRRAHSLSLTSRGRALVPQLAALADENDTDFFSHLTPSERSRLTGLLKDVVKRKALQHVPVD